MQQRPIILIGLIVIITFYYSVSVQACDVCGCGMGGQYFGILPQFQRHFIGLRLQNRSFSTMHPALFQYDKASQSTDIFTRYELWGRYAIKNRFQAFGFFPYQIAIQKGNTDNGWQGIGDPSFLVNYFVLNTGDSADHKWKHALIIGAGAKLPLGKSQTTQSENATLVQMLPGSGSIDFPFYLGYTLRRNKLGINAESNLRLNGKNDLNYRFGNRLNTSARLFFWHRIGRWTFLPSAGMAFEMASKDMQKNKLVDMTGGSLLALHLGMDLYFKNLTLQTQWQPAMESNLGQGNVSPKTRTQIGIYYLF